MLLYCQKDEKLDGSSFIEIAFSVGGGLAAAEGRPREKGPISLWSRTKFRMRLPTPRTRTDADGRSR